MENQSLVELNTYLLVSVTGVSPQQHYRHIRQEARKHRTLFQYYKLITYRTSVFTD